MSETLTGIPTYPSTVTFPTAGEGISAADLRDRYAQPLLNAVTYLKAERDLYKCVGYDIKTRSKTLMTVPGSLSVSSEITNSQGIAVRGDGTSVYVISNSGGNYTVRQYDMSSAFDIGTASYSSSLSVATHDTGPTDLGWSSDGFQLYVIGSVTERIYQYTCSTAWDVSTAVYSGSSYDPTGTASNPTSFCWSSDGTKMYINSTLDDDVYQFTAGTPWNVSTLSYASKSLNSSPQSSGWYYVRVSADGKRIFLADVNSLGEYALSTAFDASTGAYTSNTLSFSGLSPGFDFSSAGAQLFTIEDTTVRQYNTNVLVNGYGA